MKQRVPLETTWHQDVVPYPMPVCVISTRSEAGEVNVASCSSVFPWCVSPETPQVVIVTRKSSQTSTNIREMKQFCLNFMPSKTLKKVVATGRPAESGTSKHEAVGIDLEAAAEVETPRVRDAVWVAECTLSEVIFLGESQNNLIADVHGIWLDQSLAEMPKSKRLRKADVPIYFGFEGGDYFFAKSKSPKVFSAFPGVKNASQLEWDDDALRVMERVPRLFRSTAKRAIEQAIEREGGTRVTTADLERLKGRRGG